MNEMKLIVIGVLCIFILMHVGITIYSLTREKFVNIDEVNLHNLSNPYIEYTDAKQKRDKIEQKKNEIAKNNLFGSIGSGYNTSVQKQNDLENLIAKNKNLQYKNIMKKENKNATLVSRYNADNISVLPVSDNKFKILVNDKCLTVIGDKDYKLKDCTHGNYSQYFENRQISNVDESAYWTNTDVNGEYDYPFQIIKSKQAPHHCLTSGDDYISLEKCDGDNEKQHWDIESRKSICIDTR